MFLRFVILFIWSSVYTFFGPYFCRKPLRNQADINELQLKRPTIQRKLLLGFLKVCLGEYQEKVSDEPYDTKLYNLHFPLWRLNNEIIKRFSWISNELDFLINVENCWNSLALFWFALFFWFSSAFYLPCYCWYLTESSFNCQDNHSPLIWYSLNSFFTSYF